MNFKTVAAVCIALYAIPGGVAYANLVTNGGFETENLDISGNPIPPPPGWTISGDGVGIDTAFPNNGIYDVSFGASTTDPNPGTLSQVIATTPGQSYTVAFALFDEAGLAGNTFTVSFGGLTQTITGDTATVYTLVSFTAPGAGISSASTTLRFIGLNDLAAWNLDDVSVTTATIGISEPRTSMLFGTALLVGCGMLRIRRRSLG